MTQLKGDVLYGAKVASPTALQEDLWSSYAAKSVQDPTDRQAVETFAQVHISAWLASQRLNYNTTPLTMAREGGTPLEGRVWVVATRNALGHAPVEYATIVHTVGRLVAVGVLLGHASAQEAVANLAIELAQQFPYVRAVPDPIAAGGNPGVWIRAEAPVDLDADTPVLPGTMGELFSVVGLALQYVFRSHPGIFGLAMPTTIQGTHVRGAEPEETLKRLLRELGAESADQVTLTALPATGSSDPEAASRAAEQRARQVRHGARVATAGGREQLVSDVEASVLLRFGAKDVR